MPVHDWTIVDAGIYHAFHGGWTFTIQQALNGGILPPGYYALQEQHAGRIIADVLTLHAPLATNVPHPTGGVAVADAPPQVQRRRKKDQSALRRSVAVRHTSDHRLIALIELVSPANKDRPLHVAQFLDKAVGMLRSGVHVLIVDLFAPGLHDPRGLCNAIAEQIGSFEAIDQITDVTPFSVASFIADTDPELFAEAFAPGAVLPEAPLFLSAERYVNVPLERTYQVSYQSLPSIYRDLLEGREPTDG